MHTHTPHHHSLFGMHWNPANAAITILFMLLLLILLFLFLTLTAQPAQGQNAVPPTARQAATMPQFASRLAHGASRIPAEPQASHKNSYMSVGRGSRGWLPQDIVYTNGPINGTTDAWTINFGFVISDTFTSSSQAISGLTFGAWVFPGDTLQTAEISITSSEFGGTTYFDGVVNFSQANCTGNQYGYNVCTETSAPFAGPSLAGTYWVNLQNAVTAAGNPIYWDENSGPSLASENSVGTIPSEAFTLTGGGGVCQSDVDVASQAPVARALTLKSLPAPAQTFTVIHDFNGQDGADPVAGLTIDRAGNLYGTATSGGNGGFSGTVFKMSSLGSQWIFTSLYSFLGGSDGNQPSGLITTGPNGVLYGTTAVGGGSGCVGSGCGTVFALRPAAHARGSALGEWLETQLYSFTGGNDGTAGASTLVMDHVGNLYGVTWAGGIYGKGSIYELQHTVGGWQYRLLYSFTGGSDGKAPLPDFLMDSAGNLHGAAYSGGVGCGTIFELSPSAGAWMEKTLYTFIGATDGGNPNGLTMDAAGNLYGVTQPVGCAPADCGFYDAADVIFMLSPAQGSWNFTIIGNYTGLYDASISMGADGNLYGSTVFPGMVFKLSESGGTWTYTDLHDFSGSDGSWPEGNIVVDANGNVYGTTDHGGANNDGSVWQITP